MSARTPDYLISHRLRELELTANDEGGWEEFHQRRGNFFMYDHHKARRLAAEREYRALRERARTRS